jgi:hypothetical protein
VEWWQIVLIIGGAVAVGLGAGYVLNYVAVKTASVLRGATKKPVRQPRQPVSQAYPHPRSHHPQCCRLCRPRQYLRYPTYTLSSNTTVASPVTNGQDNWSRFRLASGTIAAMKSTLCPSRYATLSPKPTRTWLSPTASPGYPPRCPDAAPASTRATPSLGPALPHDWVRSGSSSPNSPGRPNRSHSISPSPSPNATSSRETLVLCPSITE